MSTENSSTVFFETWQDLEKLLNSGDVFLVDVRTANEYSQGHIPGAQLIPHTEITNSFPPLDKDSLVALYCQSGNRSSRALKALKALGYTNIVNFGSINHWKGELHYGPEP